jgi:hypothetical protein
MTPKMASKICIYFLITNYENNFHFDEVINFFGYTFTKNPVAVLPGYKGVLER